jgi:cytoskeletal protein CcmA (bactofilin family)
VVSANILGGQTIVVNAAGAPSTNVSRTLVGNLIGGQTVNVSLEATGVDTGGLRNSLIYGQGLNVSGSHSAASTAVNNITLLGRWNGEDNGLADSARTVFAVGTGTGTSNRRTGLYVTSGSLVGVSGSLDVKGNSVMSGSLTVSGSFGSINAIGDVIITGTTKMYQSSNFPLEVYGTINSQRLHFNSNPFNSNPSSNLGALRFEGTNRQFYLTNYDTAQITTQSIVSTFVDTGSAYVETSLGANNRGVDTYLRLTNASGTGSLSTNVNTIVTGSLNVSNGITGSLQGTASYATNALTASFALNGGGGGGSTFPYTGSAVITGSLTVSGSVKGNVEALSIASNTASLDLSTGNFFTLQLVSGSATHILPTNITPGQTVNIKLATTGSATVTFPSSVKQPGSFPYIPTTTTSTDIITLVSFDSSNVYLANIKNLI